MSVCVQYSGNAPHRSMKDRRKGKDRRRFLDPRYRNPAYPDFFERRQGQRRAPVYDEHHPLIEEHPFRKWIVVIGVLAVAFLIYLFLFTNVMTREHHDHERGSRGAIVTGHVSTAPLKMAFQSDCSLMKRT